MIRVLESEKAGQRFLTLVPVVVDCRIYVDRLIQKSGLRSTPARHNGTYRKPWTSGCSNAMRYLQAKPLRRIKLKAR